MKNLRHHFLLVLFILTLATAGGCGGCAKSGPGSPGAPSNVSGATSATVLEPLAHAGAEAVTLRSTIVAGEDDAREFLLADGTIVEVDEKTELAVNRTDSANGEWSIEVELKRGAIRLDVPRDEGKVFEVRTPMCVAGVRGTEFDVSHGDEGTEISVYGGTVSATAAGREELVTSDKSALLDRTGMRLAEIRAERRKRWENARARIADKLIERFELDIEADEKPDLDDVLRRIPETLKVRARKRIEERIEERRRELRKALRDLGDTIDRDAMSAQERFEAARRSWISEDEERRRVFREKVGAVQERWKRGLEALADTMSRLGNESAARELRDAARRSDESMAALNDTLARTSRVEPKFSVAVGPAEEGGTPGARRLVAAPVPPLPGDHPFVKARHTMTYRLLIGPAGAVREARFVSSTAPRPIVEKFDPVLKTWRFNAELERKPEWRTVTITTAPQ